jgi:DNA-binding MarR family transcriptional regulator
MTDRSTGVLRESNAVDGLPARLRIAVTRLNRRLRQESVTGVSPSEESALSTIRRLGKPTLGELAQAEQVQPPTMTRVVASLEAAGLVVRRVDAEDRRVARVELTAQGRAAIERIGNLKNAYLARQIATLSEAEQGQAAELAALLERLVEDR